MELTIIEKELAKPIPFLISNIRHPKFRLSSVWLMILLRREFRLLHGTDRSRKIIRQTPTPQPSGIYFMILI